MRSQGRATRWTLGIVLTIASLAYLNSTESVFNLHKLKGACVEAGIVLPHRFETIDHVNDWVDFHGDDGTSETWTIRSKEPPLVPHVTVLVEGNSDFDSAWRGVPLPEISHPVEIRQGDETKNKRGYRIFVAKQNGTYVSFLEFQYND